MNFPFSLFSGRTAICTCKKGPQAWNIVRYINENQRDNQNPTKELTKEDYDVNRVTKQDMRWREPLAEDSKKYFKTLRVFYAENNYVELARFLQSPIDLSPSSVIKWLRSKNKEKEVIMQSYIPDRNRVLGNDLAAAHFAVFRGGAVKFHGEDKWIKADKDGNYDLPEHYVRNRYLEAIDCSEMTLHYEGLENFANLNHLNWLSVNGCKNFDDWCLDRICGMFYRNLVYLDLRNCPQISERGLIALWKMESLKILYLHDVLRSSSYEMTILLLQEQLPHLEIIVGDIEDD